MPRIDESTLLSFRQELSTLGRLAPLLKEAGFADSIARAAPRLKNVGSLAGVGALAGAVGGAGVGGVRGYREAREQGAGTGRAALSGLMGGVSGAWKGGLVGGVAGGAGGALVKRDLGGLTRAWGPVGAFARSGQRQVHSLTGMLTPQELQGIRGGAYDAKQRYDALRKSTTAPSLAEVGRLNAAKRVVERMEAASGVTSPSMNLTSIPGIVRSAQQQGMRNVIATGARQSMTSPGMVAMTVVPAAASALASNEIDTQGQGKGEQIGGNIGQTAGAVVGGALPIVGQGVFGTALQHVGQLAGRGVDRLRGVKRPLGAPGMSPTTLGPTEGQHTPSERIMSPAAAGQQPDLGI